jgi:hypothetical protein
MAAKAEVGKMFLALAGDLKGLKRDLAKAQTMSKKAGASAGKSFGGQFAGATDKLSKLTGVVGGIETAFKAADIAIKVFEGDMKGAAEGVKQLPFGIGAAASALESLLGTLTGINKEMKDIEKSNKKMSDKQVKAAQSLATVKRLNLQAELIGKSPAEQVKIQAREQKRSLGAIASPRLERQAIDALNKITAEKLRIIKEGGSGGSGGAGSGRTESRQVSLTRTGFGGAQTDPAFRVQNKQLTELQGIRKSLKGKSGARAN